MRLTILLTCGLLASALLPLTVATATAQQNPFAARVIVNDRAITNYEVEQRKLFLQILRSPGDLDAEAIKVLIEDRLRQEVAAKFGVKATEEQITAGMAEFAGRAQLPVEEFITALGQEGVAPETFRDFVTAGLVWREIVRGKFAAQAKVSEADIDNALSVSAHRGAARVLLSELIIPAPPESAAEATALAERLSTTIRTEAAFAEAARQYSASASAAAGGRIDWVPLANLPGQIAPLVLRLAPGEVSAPIPVPNAIALFQLRAIEDSATLPASAVTVEYMQFFIAGGRGAAGLAEAAQVRAKVAVCNDLYAVAKGLPPEQLVVTTQPLDAVPLDIGLELAKLDEGESSVALTRGDALMFLMLCHRTVTTEPPPSRDEVRAQLINQQLNALAEAYLAQLVANATIVTP